MQQIQIDLYENQNVFVTDAYDRFAAKLSMTKKTSGENLFTISGCSPGVGTTTIAINTAISLALAKRKVLLVDADMRKNSYIKRLNLGLQYGLSDYLMEAASYDDVVCTTNFEYLEYISCGSKLNNPVMLLNSPKFDEFLAFANENYDYVIFDSPTLNATVDAGVLASKTFGVILVAGYMQTRTNQISAAKKELDQLNANIMGIILNNIHKKRYKRYVEYYNHFSKAEKKNKSKKRSAKGNRILL